MLQLKKLFGDQLNEVELYSNEDNGGGYPIKISSIKYGIQQDFSKEIMENPTFSGAVKDVLKSIYAQINHLSLFWEPHPIKSIDLIQNDEWLKATYLDQGTELAYLREELSGMMSILPFEKMKNDDAHVFWLNTDDVKYYPFDVHYYLTACLKEENGIVEDNIYIYHNRIPQIFDMKVSLMKYLELAYQAKAFYNWQMAYINKSGLDWEKMKRMLPKIFPHLEFELSEFGM